MVTGGTGTTGSSWTKIERLASVGMEATEIRKGDGSNGEASGSGTSVNLNKGGWLVRSEEENDLLLYIWILNGE